MIYTHVPAPGKGIEVVMRWSTSPTGTWSDMMVALDLTSTTPQGQQNQLLYGCSTVSQCLGAAPNEPQFTDVTKLGTYAPSMFPYLTNVRAIVFPSNSHAFNFTVSYLFVELFSILRVV